MINPCRRTPEVERAHASGAWATELSEHAAGCASCTDARLVLRSLATLASTNLAGLNELPPAAAVFRGHRLAERLRDERCDAERVALPLRLAEVAAGVMSFVGALLLADRVGASPTAAGFLGAWTAVLLLTSGSVLARFGAGDA
jgi:hypothetical protein